MKLDTLVPAAKSGAVWLVPFFIAEVCGSAGHLAGAVVRKWRNVHGLF